MYLLSGLQPRWGFRRETGETRAGGLGDGLLGVRIRSQCSVVQRACSMILPILRCAYPTWLIRPLFFFLRCR